MKKILILLIIMATMTSCFTYIKETGKFYPRKKNIKKYHDIGINGINIKQHRYKIQENKK